MTVPDTSPDDNELMLRLQNGDDPALDILMDRWRAPLQSFLCRYWQNQNDALDLAQETFVRVYFQREKFRAGAKFSTWLFTIALNLCRDRTRRNKVRPVVLQDETALAETSDHSTDVFRAAPDTDLLRTETARAVRSAIEALPDRLKTAVLLCEYEGMSYIEAAAAAGCSPKAVETRLYRARELLRKALESYLQ